MSLIDRNAVHHYYSTMIFRATILIAVAVVLSACGHLPSSSGPVTSEPAPQPRSAVEPIAESDVIDNETAPADNDLIARIRAGFDFPRFNSKYTYEYEKWNAEHPTYLNAMFARAEPFLFYIVEELEKRDMPLELALLPAIESAFKPNAVSRSRAAGLWQFIPSTGKHFGLRQDWWYDGRLDAIQATTAALDYLQQLNTSFNGDWQLTLAAYNGGQGTVRRAIKHNQRHGRGTRYQDLKLRKETTRYVPKLYALRNIIANPDDFGVELPMIPNQPHFAVVDLPGQTDINALFQNANLDVAQLQHLNAAYKRWATPPQGPHRLLVPLAHLSQTEQALEQQSTTAAVNYHDYAIRNGDTLSTIARRHGVSVSVLQSVNRLQGTRITAGDTLLIPMPGQTDNQTKSLAARPAIGQTPATLLPTADAREILHRVAPGDTLWSIAQRYRVQVAQLLSWNQLSINGILSLDQTLRVFTY